jgi:hypothetical protein
MFELTRAILFPQHEALHVASAARRPVALDEDGAHAGVVAGGLEFAGHSGEEAGEDELLFDADDAVPGAAHAHVGLVGGATGEDARIGGGDVGMGAEDGGHAPVQMPAHGHLFRGGLGVDVDQDDLGLDDFEQRVDGAEGVIVGVHEDAALEIDYGVCLAAGQGAFIEAIAWSGRRVVSRADDAAGAFVAGGGRRLHIIDDLALVPDVVAGGQDMGPEIEEFVGDSGGDAESAGGVLRIDHDQVDRTVLDDVADVFADDASTGAAEYVTDKECVQPLLLRSEGGKQSMLA